MTLIHQGLTVAGLTCQRQQRLLFQAISFQLAPGDLLLIEGPNGSGKSSLLRLAAGLSLPMQGEITWHGRSIAEYAPEYYRDLHYIGHSQGVKLGLTVEENLRLAGVVLSSRGLTAGPSVFSGKALDPAVKPRDDSNTLSALSKKIDDILHQLQLFSSKKALANTLSAGQKRRLALAKLFLIPKPLWMVDEPFTALDTHSQTIFLHHLRAHLQAGGICLLSSHHDLSYLDLKYQHLRLESC